VVGLPHVTPARMQERTSLRCVDDFQPLKKSACPQYALPQASVMPAPPATRKRMLKVSSGSAT
jgi:hypothetical protein